MKGFLQSDYTLCFLYFFEDEYFAVDKCTAKSLKFTSPRKLLRIRYTLVSSFTKNLVFYRVCAVNIHCISFLKLTAGCIDSMSVSWAVVLTEVCTTSWHSRRHGQQSTVVRNFGQQAL